jgi:hypothetical protein
MNADIGYQKGALFETGTLVVLAFSEQLDEQDIDHSLIAWWKENKWPLLSKEDLTITSICKGKGQYYSQTVFAGMYGDILIGTPSGMRMEHLGEGDDAPNRLRTIHEVRAIGEQFVAVGMRRQVFRKHMASTSWEKMDAGVYVTDESKEIAGFISVDGFSEREIYAVGHRGEIWLFDGEKWTQIESPTNLILNCVRCMPGGDVFICGDAGVILRGRQYSWKQVDQDITADALTSLAGLGDHVYFATEGETVISLYQDSVEVVQAKKGKPITTGFLDSNGNSLLSVGESDIYLYDGKKWRRLPDPEFKVPSTA